MCLSVVRGREPVPRGNMYVLIKVRVRSFLSVWLFWGFLFFFFFVAAGVGGGEPRGVNLKELIAILLKRFKSK